MNRRGASATPEGGVHRHAGFSAASLKAYADGELSPVAAAWVRAHISRCAQCRADIDSLNALSRAVRRAAEPDAPPELRGRILRSLPLEPRSSAPAAGAATRLRPALALSACALVLVVGAWAGERALERPSSGSPAPGSPGAVRPAPLPTLPLAQTAPPDSPQQLQTPYIKPDPTSEEATRIVEEEDARAGAAWRAVRSAAPPPPQPAVVVAEGGQRLTVHVPAVGRASKALPRVLGRMGGRVLWTKTPADPELARVGARLLAVDIPAGSEDSLRAALRGLATAPNAGFNHKALPVALPSADSQYGSLPPQPGGAGLAAAMPGVAQGHAGMPNRGSQAPVRAPGLNAAEPGFATAGPAAPPTAVLRSVSYRIVYVVLAPAKVAAIRSLSGLSTAGVRRLDAANPTP